MFIVIQAQTPLLNTITEKGMNKTSLSVLICLMMIILSACSASQPTAVNPSLSSSSSASGSAASTPQYEEVSGNHTRWIGDKLVAGNYKHLLIDSVVMDPAPKGLTSGQQALLDELFTTFNKILLNGLSAKVSVVNAPGDGVARLQPTFTNISSTMQGMKAYEVVPLAALLGGIKAATGTRDKEVELWLEAELVDSQTNEILARIIRKGSADQADRKQAEVEDVREMLQQWAKESATAAAELFN